MGAPVSAFVRTAEGGVRLTSWRGEFGRSAYDQRTRVPVARLFVGLLLGVK
jgi:hypothetical protein